MMVPFKQTVSSASSLPPSIASLVYWFFIVITLCFSCSKGGYAQTKRKELKILGLSIDSLLQAPIKEIDTSYIKPYYKYLHIHPLLENRNYTLFVNGNNNTVSYKPNVSSAVGVGLAYKWFSFDFTFKIPFSERAIARKGKTNQLGLGFSYTGRKLWLNTYFQSAKGLYVSNPEVIDIKWFNVNAGYPLRKDLLVRTLYTRGFYYFNYKKFSNPASFSFQERQKKSVGSFIIGGSLLAFQLRADSTLLPLSDYLAKLNMKFINHNSYSLTINPGYTHTLVIKRIFFATVALRPGLALRLNQNFANNDSNKAYSLQVGWQGDGMATLGINNDRYYGGVAYSLLFFSDNLERTGIYNSHSYLRLIVGRRFNFKPKGLLKEVPGF